MAAMAESLVAYMEAVAKREAPRAPAGYGYKTDDGLEVGYLIEERTQCKVLDKPIVIPTGSADPSGYSLRFVFGGKDAIRDVLAGKLPPHLPSTTKEPKMFPSLMDIANNFGAADPAKMAPAFEYCMAFRVPSALAAEVAVPGRDLWMLKLSEDKITPLIGAVQRNDLAVAKEYLTNHSGDVCDHLGVSLLMMAAFEGHSEMCKVILDSKADVNREDTANSRTALMYAAQNGDSKTVEVLLAAGADATKVDKELNSALSWAAVAGKTSTVKLLLPHTDTALKNAQGLTAMELALKNNHKDVVELLK